VGNSIRKFHVHLDISQNAKLWFMSPFRILQGVAEISY